MELLTIPVNLPKEKDWHGRQVTYIQPKECPIMKKEVRSFSEKPRTGLVVGLYMKTNEEKFDKYCETNDISKPAPSKTDEEWAAFYEEYLSMIEEEIFFFIAPDKPDHETIVQNLEFGPLKGTFIRRSDIQEYSDELYEEAMLTHEHAYVREAAREMMADASVVVVWPPKIVIELSEALVLLR